MEGRVGTGERRRALSGGPLVAEGRELGVFRRGEAEELRESRRDDVAALVGERVDRLEVLLDRRRRHGPTVRRWAISYRAGEDPRLTCAPLQPSLKYGNRWFSKGQGGRGPNGRSPG